MNPLKRAFVLPLKTSLLFIVSCFFAGAVHAALLGVTLQLPIIPFSNDANLTFSTNYDAGTEIFKVSGTPARILIPAPVSSPPNTPPSSHSIVDSSAGNKKLSINIIVDNTGALVGGLPSTSYDLKLIGKVQVPDPANPANLIVKDGVLLTADVTAFGFLNGIGNTDYFDMTFTVTGGELAYLYPNSAIAVSYFSELTTNNTNPFVGVFTQNFVGDAKGNIGLIEPPPPSPKIEVCTLVSNDGGLTYFDADNIVGDSCDVYPQATPSILLGENATYKYVVTNVGDEILINVNISDSIPGSVGVPLPGGDLLVGQMRMVDAGDGGFSQLTIIDICGGTLSSKTNIATATGTGVTSGTTVSDDDPASITCTVTPLIDILTEVSVDGGAFFDANTPATAVFASSLSDAEYKLTVTNTGTEDLINVTLKDSVLGIVDVNIGNLAAGASVMLTSADMGFASLSVPMICDGVNGNIFYDADVIGTGTVSGLDVTDIDPAVVICNDPQITILRQVSIDGGMTFAEADAPADLDVPVGIVGVTDAVYRYIVKNVGTEVLTDVVITDADLGITQGIADLAIMEERIITVLDAGFAALDLPNVCTDLGFVNGIAVVNAIGIGSLATTSDQNPAYLRCLTTPQIDILTEVSVDGVNFFDANTVADAVFASSLDDAEYKLTVKNTSDEDLVDVIISDPGFGIINVNIGSLAVNEMKMFTSADFGFESLAVPKICEFGGTITYSADADGFGALSGLPVTDTDPAVVVCGDPVVKILKQISIDGGTTWAEADNPGDADVPVGVVGVTDAVYRYIVENIGTEDLTDVVIDDPSMGINQPITNLIVNEKRFIYHTDPGFGNLDMPDVCQVVGIKSTTATVEAIGINSLLPASDSNPAVIRCIEGPQIMLLNQVSLTGGAPFFDADLPTDPDVPVGIVGLTDATYRYIVKNVGDETLRNIVLNDSTLGVVNFELVGVTLAPGNTYTVDVAELAQLDFPNRCTAVGNKMNTATVNAFGDNSGIPVNDMNDANVNCTPAPVCSITLDQQCAIVDVPNTDDLLCQSAINGTTLKYTGPNIMGANVVFEGANDGLATYTNVDLISGVTILTSVSQNGFTVSASAAQSDSLGSKTYITINGVLEIIHTSCSAVYYAGRPAPLDANTPNPANSDKGDPSPNWFVVNFEDKDGNYVSAGTGQPGTFMENCSAVSNSAVEFLHKYTVTNTGTTPVQLTSIDDSSLGEVLDVIPTLIPAGGMHMVQTSSSISGSVTQSTVASAYIDGNTSAMCIANDTVEIVVEAPMLPISCSDIKPLTSLSMIWTGQDGVNIETANGQTFTGVNNNNQITFTLLSNQNDSDLYITDALTGASLGTSRFHKSCSDSEMDGNDDCGMSQGDGKGNEAGLLNLFLLDGMIGENGSFACNLANSGVAVPTPSSGGSGGPTDAITAEAVLDLGDDKIKWRLFNNSNTDLFITEITVRWPSDHLYIEKMKLEGDFAKDEAVEFKPSPTTVGIAEFESDQNKRKLKADDDKNLEIEFKDKFKNGTLSDYYISVTFDNGQTLTIGTP